MNTRVRSHRYSGRKWVAALAMACLTALSAKAAHAGTLLWINDNNDNIGTLDITTGTVSVLGNASTLSPGLGDIGFDSLGNLWGIDGNSRFYSINKTTGLGTFVGNTGTGLFFNSLVGGANGSLYAAANVSGANSTHLFTINSATGSATDLGNIGFNAAGDLAFVNGVLYESAVDPTGGPNNLLVRINLGGSPTAVQVGNFGISQVYGLASDNSGTLYALSGTEVYTVNLSTAGLTPLLNYGGHGLIAAAGEAFQAESGGASPVPLPAAAWSGMLLLAGIGAAGAGKRLLARA